MIESVFTVTGEATVAEAAALMVQKRVSCLPISMGQGAIGIITEKDIIARVVAIGRDPKKTKVKEIMSTPLILSPLNTTIKEAAEKMLQNQVRRLVVTSKDGKLVGLITMTDIIRWISQGEGNASYMIRYLSEMVEDKREA